MTTVNKTMSDEPSISGYKQSDVSNPTIASESIRRQKSAHDDNDDDVNTPMKIRKIETQTGSNSRMRNQIQRVMPIPNQSQSNHTHNQSYHRIQSRGVTTAFNSSMDESRDFNKLPEVFNSSSQSQTLLSIDRIRSNDMEDRLTRADLKIKKLQKNLCQADEENKTLRQHVDGKVQMQNELVEKQKVSWQLMSAIKEQTDVLTDTLKRCKESREQLTKLYDSINLKQDKIRDLNKRYECQIDEEKNLREKLTLKISRLSVVQNMYKLFDNEMMEKTQFLREIVDKREIFEATIKEDEKKYYQHIKRMMNSMKNCQQMMKTEFDTKHKLVTESNENLKTIKELQLKCQALQLTSSEYENRVKDLKSRISVLEEKVASLKNDIVNTKSENIHIISKKDTELSVRRKQLEDMKTVRTEAVDKLTKIISNNEELFNTTSKTLRDIERLKTNIEAKDDELIKIRAELTETLAKNERLSADSETLGEELIVEEKQISQMKDHLKTYEAAELKYVEEEARLSTELAAIESNLKNKSDDVSKLITTKNDEDLKYAERINSLKTDGDKRFKQINNIERTTIKLREELEYDESQYSSEIQHATQLSKQCKILGHEKKIKQQDKKIDILKRELSAKKQLFERFDKEITDADRKEREKWERELNELKSNYNDLNDKFSAITDDNETLQSKLQNVQTFNNDEEKVIREEDRNENEQSLIKSPFKSILKSNSKESPSKVQKVRFDITSALDMSGIKGSDMMEEAERRYRDSSGSSNRPDWLNLQIPMTATETDKSPIISLSQRKPGARRFFKRTEPEKKITDLFDEDSNDPYAFN